MKRVKVVIGVILLFAAGALAGSLGTGVYMKNRFEKFVRGGPPKGMILEKLSSELDLTESQKKEIEIILDDSQKKLHKIRKKVHPEIEKIIEASHGRIREKLDKDQQTKFDEMHKKFMKRFRKKMHKKFMKRFRNKGFPPKPM